MSEESAAVAARRIVISGEQIVRWAVRLLWVALPFTAGPALAGALDGASRPVQAVASLGLWAGWAAGVAASAVALPVALTALRLLAPAAVAATAVAVVAGDGPPLAVGWSVVTAGWVFAPTFGALCVNGPAYPNERRFLLRAPAPLMFGPLALAWALSVAGVAAGPLLLAARQWVLGALLTAAGPPLAWLLVRGMYDLSRRWVVFVPAGVVLHDPLTVVDPVLVQRRSIAAIGPALVGTAAVDLTQRSPGLALEIAMKEPLELTLVRPGRRQGDPVSATAVLVTPTRPGALLDEARRRRLPARS
ncbi:MAG: hypothetical protein ACLGI2_12965 [Acidimicrobiia bacterium]